MHQVADTIFSLGTRGHNYYLIRDGDELTMVDAGCSKEWKHLERSVADLGLSIDAIAGVIATHAHSDHFGLAKQATELGIDVSVHTDEETRALGEYRGRFSASSKDLPLFSIRTLRNFLPMLRAGVTSLEFVDSVGTFADGDVLDLPGRPTAIHTPGHTEGHVMFHCDALEVLFAGDGMATMDLLGSRTGPQRMNPVFDLDSEMALRSLDRLDGVEASLILPGHGKPFHGSTSEAVEKVRASAA